MIAIADTPGLLTLYNRSDPDREAVRKAADQCALLVATPPTPDHLDVALSLRVRYDSLGLDLVDAVNVALAAEYDTDAVLTRDIRD
ncbi:PIN domain-containing protein [Streptomyces sp. NPDC054866]